MKIFWPIYLAGQVPQSGNNVLLTFDHEFMVSVCPGIAWNHKSILMLLGLYMLPHVVWGAWLVSVGTKVADEQPTHCSLSVPEGCYPDHQLHFRRKACDVMTCHARRASRTCTAGNEHLEVMAGCDRQDSAHPSGQNWVWPLHGAW